MNMSKILLIMLNSFSPILLLPKRTFQVFLRYFTLHAWVFSLDACMSLHNVCAWWWRQPGGHQIPWNEVAQLVVNLLCGARKQTLFSQRKARALNPSASQKDF